MTIAAGTKYKSVHAAADFDAIVIGSGMGSLSTASLLAQAGKRVLVLEQHYTIGGCTHSFSRKGYEWDVGLHYVGDVQSKSSILRQIFDRVTNSAVDWAALPSIYNRFVIADKTYDIPAGREAYAKQMKEYFPAEADVIDGYIDLVYAVNKSGASFFGERAVAREVGDTIYEEWSKDYRKYSDRTTYDVLSEITSNQELIAVLTGNFGDYGLPPKQSSFAAHAQVVKHYMKGASFPVGGPPMIAASIIPIIEGAGGKVLYAARVEEILVEQGNAVGVRVSNGDKILAPIVISGAGVHNTFNRMLPEAVGTKYELSSIPNTLKPAYTVVGLNAGIKASGADIGLNPANIWAHPTNDFDENVRTLLAPDDDTKLTSFITFPSMRDPSWEERYPNRATISMYCQVPFSLFEPWADIPSKDRGADYQALKDKYEKMMLAELYRVVPEVEGKLDYYEIASPLSINNFLGREAGNFMGLSHSPERYKQRSLRPDTAIKNLYLTGQDITADGMSGAISAGVLCASAVLKKDMMQDILNASPKP